MCQETIALRADPDVISSDSNDRRWFQCAISVCRRVTEGRALGAPKPGRQAILKHLGAARCGRQARNRTDDRLTPKCSGRRWRAMRAAADFERLGGQISVVTDEADLWRKLL